MNKLSYTYIYLKLKLKNALNKLLNKKVLDLDNDGKIESLRDEVSGVFSHFKVMLDKLDSVNHKLEEVIEDEEKQLKADAEEFERLKEKFTEQSKQRMERIVTAEKEQESNERLKNKVSEFVV